MHLKIIGLPTGMIEFDLAVKIPKITRKMASSYAEGEVCITDGNDEDIRKLAEKGIILEKVSVGE